MLQMIVVALLALVTVWPQAAWAGETKEPAPKEEAAEEAAPPPSEWKPGPQDIDLGHDLKLALPEAYVYLPPGPASKMLEKNGSFHNQNLLGIVASKDEEAQWFATVHYQAEGYIKDDEKIDAEELLSAIREGTEEGNKERVEKGFKPWRIDGWSEPPKYDKSLHHLVWALSVSDDEGTSVNFNTRILGRRGYVAINLVTSPELLAGYKPEAATLLGATTFSSTARYEAFDAKTDKVAEYGLAGLVLGGAGLGAAKLVKIGLLAKFWKVIIGLLIAGKKGIVLVIAGIAAFAKKLFGRKANSVADGEIR